MAAAFSGFAQFFKEQRKCLFYTDQCTSNTSEDDTCTVFYSTADNYKLNKIKNFALWKDWKRFRASPYYYVNIFLSHFTNYGALTCNTILGRKGLRDSLKDHDYSPRDLRIALHLKKLKGTSVKLLNPEFGYDYEIEMAVTNKFNDQIFKTSIQKNTGLLKSTEFMDNRDAVQAANIGRYVDTLIVHSLTEMLSPANLSAIDKKLDSLIASRTKVPPIILKSQNHLQPSKVAAYLNSAVTIKVAEGHGSGCIVSDDGYIITNYHVVDADTQATVVFNDGSSQKAKVVRTHPEEDLALLKVDSGSYKPFYLKSEDEYAIGTEVYAIGTPADVELGQTVSKGIVSGHRKFYGTDYIQMDIRINPGNSGGALIYKSGELVGIINAKMMGRGVEGIGFAIPSKRVLSSLVLSYK